MSDLRWTRQAERDLFDVWLWIARDDPRSADNVLDRLDRLSRLIGKSPRMGVARPEIAPALRSFPVRRWLILYRIVPDGVEVVRYVDGARDLPRLLLEAWWMRSCNHPLYACLRSSSTSKMVSAER